MFAFGRCYVSYGNTFVIFSGKLHSPQLITGYKLTLQGAVLIRIICVILLVILLRNKTYLLQCYVS
jgi:hypothetical protein